MKRYLLILALLLAACSSSTPVTPESVIAWVKANCGFVVNVVDVAALISKDPTTMVAAAIGRQICDAIQAQSPTAQPGSSGGVVVINGVPVHYTVQ